MIAALGLMLLGIGIALMWAGWKDRKLSEVFAPVERTR